MAVQHYDAYAYECSHCRLPGPFLLVKPPDKLKLFQATDTCARLYSAYLGWKQSPHTPYATVCPKCGPYYKWWNRS